MSRSTFNNNKGKKTLVALSLAFVSSLSVCLFAACDEEDTDASSSLTDNCTIANGNFEYYTDEDDLSLIVSPSSWTKSVGADRNSNSANSSTKASGVVNTESSKWANLTEESGLYTEGMTLKQVKANWESFTAKDRLKFYEAVENGDYKASDSVESLSDFEYYADYEYGIDYTDIPDCENPGTHDNGVYTYTGDEDKTETSVLMIHNYRSDGYGTAQKYTSSTTVTVAANTSATFSVWVKTSNLTYNNGSDVSGNRGAYIGVTHTVGSLTLDQMQIKNIDTAGVTENNGWVQYTVYLKGCSYADSTFSIVLGLGQGSSTNRYENVAGYAFFDDVVCESISDEAYEEAVSGANVPSCSGFSSETDKFFATDDERYANATTFALDLSQEFTPVDFDSDAAVSIDLTKETFNNISYTTTNYKGLGISTADDVTCIDTLGGLKGRNNGYLKTILANDFEQFPFAEDEKIIMLMSANGAAYTAEIKPESDAFTVAPDEYMMVSFWVKTSELDGYTGATITLVDGENETSIGAFDSTTVDTIDIDEKEDLYDGWVQCFFFLKNETSASHDFYLKLSYGPTTITGTSKSDYLEGYAAFASFKTYRMNSDEFSCVAEGTYASSVSLTGTDNETADSGFDSVIYSDTKAIKEGLATPLNYQGVDGGSYYVGGDSYSYANSNEYAGLVNKNYAANYSDRYAEDNWLGKLLLIAGYEQSSLTTALETASWWNELFGTSTQPLLIVNAVEQSYGYIATENSTFSSSAYTAVSVNVKVSKGAIAYVYLIDASSLEDGYDNALSIKTPEVTYWYDDDGNICSSDPTDDDFNEKTDIVYYLNENGLYESADASDTTLYANLAAFKHAYEQNSDYSENTDSGMNLVTDSGAIVFYYHDGAYYAQYDAEKDTYLLPVSDLDHSYARYTAESRDLFTVLDNRDGSLGEDWHTVSFYVVTGDKSLTYRLEVFSGSRDGSVKSAAGSYVAFDTVTPSSLSDSYDDLLSEAIAAIDEADNGISIDKESGRLVDGDGNVYKDASYYTFTYYDSNDYLRYDENADPTNNYVLYENASDDPGNLYSAYQQSGYEEQLIYLKADAYTTFVDYTAIDTAVSPDTVDSDEEETSAEFNYEVFLMVVSIVLAAVLIFTLIALWVRRIVQRIKRKKLQRTNAYKTPRRTYKRARKDDSEKK